MKRTLSWRLAPVRLFVVAVMVPIWCVVAAQGVVSGFMEIHGVGVDDANVYVDDAWVGRIEVGRLLVSDLRPGRHVVRVEKDGYFPLLLDVEVVAAAVAGVRVRALVPRVQDLLESAIVLEATLNATSSSISLMCFPMDCGLRVLEFPAHYPPTGRGTYSKGFGDAVLRIAGLPQGAYRFRIISGEQSVEFAAGLCHGDSMATFVDFTRSPIDLSFTVSAYPACPVLQPTTGE